MFVSVKRLYCRNAYGNYFNIEEYSMPQSPNNESTAILIFSHLGLQPSHGKTIGSKLMFRFT